MIIDTKKLLQIIKTNIDEKIPSSFIRKGDGENIFIGYGNLKGIKLTKYLKIVKIMNIRYSHISFQKFIKKELIIAFRNCDYLGIAPEVHRHNDWSYEDRLITKFEFNSKKFCDMNFHLKFIKLPLTNKLKSEIVKDIISNKRIGVISCFKIDNFLNHYNSEVSCFIEIIKQRNRNPFNKITMSTYQTVFELIDQNINLDFWLVAAGIHAKIFCNYIKNNSGIAIDIGSSIDTWNDVYENRGHLRRLVSDYSK